MAGQFAMKFPLMVLLAVFASSHAYAAKPAPKASPPAPTPLALSCLACHQPGGHPIEIPSLAEKSANDIATALRAARDQPKAESIMARFAKAMTDVQINALANELGAKSQP